MPYSWSRSSTRPQAAELRLWPHQSLPPKGFVAFILATFVLLLVPLVPVLGSVVLWGLLPFLMAALGGVWLALQANWKSKQIVEVLTLSDEHARLCRHNPRCDVQEWDCNRYWVRPA